MEGNSIIKELTRAMIAFDKGDPRRIQHFIKVHAFAALIGSMEGLDEHTRFILECAALTHDIGIIPSERKYDYCNGKLQEQEGPVYAGPMLRELGLDEADIGRICYLIGHHHTYSSIDGIDYQILVEADFLVNMYEDHEEKERVEQVLKNIFRTRSGTAICCDMFGAGGI